MSKTQPVILIVEDNPINRDVLGRRLSRRNFLIRFAEDGPQAVDYSLKFMPDVILMDINLGEMNGHEATRKILSNPGTAHIPVIALTANAFDTDRVLALEAGCVDFDTKPVDLDRLIGKIAAALSRPAVD